jgi:hypothetical protein
MINMRSFVKICSGIRKLIEREDIDTQTGWRSHKPTLGQPAKGGEFLVVNGDSNKVPPNARLLCHQFDRHQGIEFRIAGTRTTALS